jgi:hypothetical protein
MKAPCWFCEVITEVFIITGFLDFVRRPEFQILENIPFRKLDLFPSSLTGPVIKVISFYFGLNFFNDHQRIAIHIETESTWKLGA